MNEIPKAVFTRKGFKPKSAGQSSPAKASWAATTVYSGDLAKEIKELKAKEGKPIVALGGAAFMRSLISTGLIDEFHLAIHPVVLGSGLPIFTDVTIPLYLKLAEAKSFPGGVVIHTYRNQG
jgi:dihydrofolate reductase